MSQTPLHLTNDRSLEELAADGELAQEVQWEGLRFVAERMPRRTSRRLYEIEHDLEALEYLLLDLGGALDPETEEIVIDQWLAELRDERDAKLDGYVAVIRDAEERAGARKRAASAMTALRMADERLAQKLRGRLLAFLQRQGETKIDTTHFRIRRVANGGQLALDWKVDEDQYAALPEPLREERVTYVPKQEEVRAALDAALRGRRERVEKARRMLLEDKPSTHAEIVLDEMVRQLQMPAEASANVRAGIRDVFRNISDPLELYEAIRSDFHAILDDHFPPSEAEAILAFVDYKPKGEHLRFD